MHDEDEDVHLIPGLEYRRSIIAIFIVCCGVIHFVRYGQFREAKLQIILKRNKYCLSLKPFAVCYYFLNSLPDY